jgi:hypothetical protein
VGAGVAGIRDQPIDRPTLDLIRRPSGHGSSVLMSLPAGSPSEPHFTTIWYRYPRSHRTRTAVECRQTPP